MYFCLKKKSNDSLNKKVIFVFHTIFNLDFITIIYCYYPQMTVFSFHTFFCSLISVSKKLNIETILTPPYPNNWQKFNNKINEKKISSIRVWTLNM